MIRYNLALYHYHHHVWLELKGDHLKINDISYTLAFIQKHCGRFNSFLDCLILYICLIINDCSSQIKVHL